MHKFNMEMDPTCVLAKIPVVLAEEEVQITVSNVTCLEKPALKVDKINAEVRNLECDFRLPKVIVSGTVHKQIFYVNRDNELVHQSEDVPFSQSIELEDLEDFTKQLHIKKLKDLEDMLECQFFKERVDVKFMLHRSSRVQQDVLVRFLLKVSQIEQVLLPQVGGVKGEIICPDGHAPVFFEVKLFDDEDFLLGRLKRLFFNGDAKFRFVSLPAPGDYRLEIVAVCEDDEEYACYRKVLEVEVEPCFNTEVNVKLDKNKCLPLDTRSMFASEGRFSSMLEEIRELIKRVQGL